MLEFRRFVPFAVLTASMLACSPDNANGTTIDDSSNQTAETTETDTDSDTDTDTDTDTDSDTDSDTDTNTDTGTGDPSGECGDGILDPGEDCDDGNVDDGDGCTPTCELGLCGFEWVTRELVLDGGQFQALTPLVVDGPELVVAHQLGAGAQQTGIVRAASSDGQVFASATIDFGDDAPTPTALAVHDSDPRDLFIASANAIADTATVRALSSDGVELWASARPSSGVIAELALSPAGELLLVNTLEAGPMNIDVELAALDPADGAQLWAHSFGGPTAPNGFSTDRAAALVLDAEGRAFVGFDQYVAWDTLAPVVIAFAPGGAPEPLWTTQVADMPGRAPEITDLALGPDGTLALSFQRWDGSQKFWVAALDAQTGVVQWVVERDDFALPDQLSSVRAVAVSADRVLATGTWIAKIDGLEVYQAYVLGLGLDGSLVCVGTLDDHEPGQSFTGESWLPFDLLAADGGFYLSGYVHAYTSPGGPVDLLLARVQ